MSAHLKRMARANQLAAQYLKSNPLLDANRGFVVLWKMKPFGWICDLNRPKDMRPGVLAVAPSSQVFQATGGDYFKGATEWSSIFEPLPAAPVE